MRGGWAPDPGVHRVAEAVERWFDSHRDADGWHTARQRHDDLMETVAATPCESVRDVYAKMLAFRLHVAWWGWEGDAVRMASDLVASLERLAGGPLAVAAPREDLDAPPSGGLEAPDVGVTRNVMAVAHA